MEELRKLSGVELEKRLLAEDTSKLSSDEIIDRILEKLWVP